MKKTFTANVKDTVTAVRDSSTELWICKGESERSCWPLTGWRCFKQSSCENREVRECVRELKAAAASERSPPATINRDKNEGVGNGAPDDKDMVSI